MRFKRDNFAGFTLIELVLVLVVIAVMAGMVAPRLSGFSRARKPGDVAQTIVSLAHYARSQAIADSEVCRLNIDSKNGTFWVSKEQSGSTSPGAVPAEKSIGSNLGDVHRVPDGLTVKFFSATPDAMPPSQDVDLIYFYADGRTDPGSIVVTDTNNPAGAITVACPTATDVYRIVEVP